MNFKELIKQVQFESGLSAIEAKQSLEMLVESIAVRLEEADRLKFAQRLPEYLHDIALSVLPSRANTEPDIINQFMDVEKISRLRARQQARSAWNVIRNLLEADQAQLIMSRLRSQAAPVFG